MSVLSRTIIQRYVTHMTNGITFKQTSTDGGETWRDDPYVTRGEVRMYGPPTVFYHVYAYDGKRCVLNDGSRNLPEAHALADDHEALGYEIKLAIREEWPIDRFGAHDETYREVLMLPSLRFLQYS